MICPNCNNDQTVTEGNFGALFTCKSCQAVYFIGFDGKPEFGEIQPYEIIPDEPLDMSTLPPTNLPDAISAVMDELSKTNEVAVELDPMQPLTDFNQNEFSVDTQPFEALVPQPVQSTARSPFADIAKEISDYGNSESQIAHLNYDLRVAGLDTAELISGLKEAIDDSRFGWDMNEVMKTMKAGEIRFEKLNPVKAFILAKRLQFLNVDKIWNQNAVG